MKELEKIRTQFAKDYKSNGGSPNAFIGLVLDDMSYQCLGGGPCHGALQQYQLQSKLTAPVKYILSWVIPLQSTVAFANEYIRWLANESPWADVFVVKDVEDIKKFGWVVSADYPHNFVASALIATRNITEKYTDQVCARLPIYEEILRLGFSHAEAYIFSATYNKVSSGKKLYPIQYARLSSGHSPFELTYANEAYYRNFLNKSPSNLKDKTFKQYNGYTGDVCAVWAKGGSKDAFSDWMKGLKPKVATAAKNYNIFEKAPVKGYVINSPEDFKNILEQALERIHHA